LGNANNSQATAPPARILPQLPVSPPHPYVNRHYRRAICRQVQSISITRQSHATTPTPSILRATHEKTRYFPYSQTTRNNIVCFYAVGFRNGDADFRNCAVDWS
jgi:hypothetical protein